MKPFDPKTAKNGDKVAWQGAYIKPVADFYYYVGPHPVSPGVSVITTDSGTVTSCATTNLYIPKTKRTVWINLIKYHPGDAMSYAYVYDTEYQAKEELKSYTGTCIGTYPLEIEE